MKHTLPSARPSAAPINGLEAFRRQFDRLFDDFASPMLGFGNGDLMPQTDYAETDNEIRVTAELPGVDAKDVEITLSDGALRIRGEKKFERDEEEAEVGGAGGRGPVGVTWTYQMPEIIRRDAGARRPCRPPETRTAGDVAGRPRHELCGRV